MSATARAITNEHGLRWDDREGVGFLPIKNPAPYDEAYFRKYQAMADTDMGRELTWGRVDFVDRHHTGELVDIGIGSGQFVSYRGSPRTTGYDINPLAVEWLKERGAFCDPYTRPVRAAAFWDSLEHIENPSPLLRNVQEWVFVSIPIFKGLDHVLRSKHFRKDEHYWYFTRAGLINVMDGEGFDVIDMSRFETVLGREDIETFAFRRR